MTARLSGRALAVCARTAAAMALLASSVLADPAFKLEGGGLRDLGADSTGFYYRLDYEGMKLAAHGESFGALPNPNQVLARLVQSQGDNAELTARLERGAVGTGGDLFTVVGIKPLTFALPALEGLRGTAAASGSLDGHTTTYGAGLETPPVHAPLSAYSIPNWLIVGLAAERRHRDSTTTDFKESSVLQVRWFIGRGLGRRVNSELQLQERDQAVAGLRALVHTYREAEAYDRDWKAAHSKSKDLRPPVPGAIGGILRGCQEQVEALSAEQRAHVEDDPAWWADRVAEWASNETLPADQPPAAIWVDGYVRRQYGANRATNAALQLIRAQLQVWLVPRSPDQGWVTLSYINGFDQASPAVRRNQMQLTIGMSF